MAHMRIVFHAGRNLFTQLGKRATQRGYTSLASMIRRDARLGLMLDNLAAEGYTEIVLRNPRTAQTQILKLLDERD